MTDRISARAAAPDAPPGPVRPPSDPTVRFEAVLSANLPNQGRRSVAGPHRPATESGAGGTLRGRTARSKQTARVEIASRTRASAQHTHNSRLQGFSDAEIERVFRGLGGSNSLAGLAAHAPRLKELGYGNDQIVAMMVCERDAEALGAVLECGPKLSQWGCLMDWMVQIVTRPGGVNTLYALHTYGGQINATGYSFERLFNRARRHDHFWRMIMARVESLNTGDCDLAV